MFEGNTYTNNYASNGKGILSVTGAQFVILKSENFINNAESFDEILDDY